MKKIEEYFLIFTNFKHLFINPEVNKVHLMEKIELEGGGKSYIPSNSAY